MAFHPLPLQLIVASVGDEIAIRRRATGIEVGFGERWDFTVQLPVVSRQGNAPADQSFGSTKCVVREKDVFGTYPTPFWIIVAAFGDAIRLDGEINSGVTDVDDLQVAHAAAWTEFSRSDLAIGDAL